MALQIVGLKIAPISFWCYQGLGAVSLVEYRSFLCGLIYNSRKVIFKALGLGMKFCCSLRY